MSVWQLSEERLVRVNEAAAAVHVFSHAFQRSAAVSDSIAAHRCPHGRAVLRLEAYVDRFRRSAEGLGLSLPASRERLIGAVVRLLRQHSAADLVRLCAFTETASPDRVYSEGAATKLLLSVEVSQQKRSVAGEFEVEPGGDRLNVATFVDAFSPAGMGVGTKAPFKYGASRAALRSVTQSGFDELLLVDQNGGIREAATASFFLVSADGSLLVPPRSRVLSSVTREVLIDLARMEGIETYECTYTLSRVRRAREAFLTGTRAGVRSVSTIDGIRMRDGAPGPVACRLRAGMREAMLGKDPRFAQQLTLIDNDPVSEHEIHL